MSFIIDDTGFHNQPKSDLTPSTDPLHDIAAADWQEVIAALLDTQSFLRGAPWVGLTPQAGDPAPPGVPHYAWLKTDGTLNLDAITKFIGGAQLKDTAVVPGSYTNLNATIDQQGRVTAASNGSSGGGTPNSPEFGGATGDFVMDGAATIFGLVPSGNVYTATADIACHNLTINSGVTLKMHNFGGPWCSGTLTNNGTISNDGNDAPDFTGGAATPTGRFGATMAGGGGNGTDSANAANGIFTATAAAAGGSGPGGVGAAGTDGCGNGGGGGATSTGGGGAGSPGGATTIQASNRFASHMALLTGYFDTGFITRITFGSGGGEGSTGVGGAGGGGAGGGMLYIAAKIIAGTGNIHARGGAGSVGVNTHAPGGGGGGGGLVCVIFGTGGGNQTIDTNGGAGGAGNSGGGAGGVGGKGVVLKFNLSGDGTNP